LGARDAKECLLIQLEHLEAQDGPQELVRSLLEQGLDDLGRGRYGYLAGLLGVTQAEILAARDYIRKHLRPYPLADPSDFELWEQGDGPGIAPPDVIVRKLLDGAGYRIEIVESRRFHLYVNPLYGELASEATATGGQTSALTPAECEALQAQVRRAESFLGHIRERRETMRRVAECVMAAQAGFLERGPRHLRPLTRAEVAETLQVHESTISRATKDKFVMLPNRQVVPFATFFKASLSVQDALREIIDAEESPLSDAELAERLGERGYRLARRTVTKYRKEMGILPSNLR
jgi:RNA polymerase sigma-54 factor